MGDIILPEPSPSPSAPRRSSAPEPAPENSRRSSPEPHGSDDVDLELSLDEPSSLGRKRPFAVLDSDDEQQDYSVLVRSLAKHKNLDTSSELELEQFSRLRLKEQLIAIQATQLVIKQAQAAQSNAAAWAIPPELESNIVKYGTAFAFSANSRAYKKWATETVLAAMRAGKVALPPDSDIGRLDKVLKRIGEKLTDYRSEMKRKIKESIPAQTDVATLAAEIVQGYGVKLTVEFYHRVAWLRSYGPQVGFDKKGFWDNIDALLEKARKQFPENARYSAHFKSIYRKDIAAFGTEATEIAVVAFTAVPEHQRIVEKTATEATSSTRKRPRMQTLPAGPATSSSGGTPRPE